MRNETTKLSDRIAELETELAAEFDRQAGLESALAEAYVTARGEGPALKSLSDSRDKTAGQVQALKKLDLKLFEVQGLEHQEIAAELDAESHKKYEIAARSTVSALRPLRKSLISVIDEPKIQPLLDGLLEHVKKIVWEEIDKNAQEEYVSRVPLQPIKAHPRNDRGIPTDPNDIAGRPFVAIPQGRG